MKRSPFKRRTGAKTLKPKSAAAKRAKAQRRKRLGKPKVARSAVRKGPARSEEHLARVRLQPCCVPYMTCGVVGDWGYNKIEAHHVRCIGPRTMGKCVSDYLTVPLCQAHHAKLHTMSEELFWEMSGKNPRDFIRSFSEEGRAALAALEEKE